jgi:hypothetical protein
MTSQGPTQPNEYKSAIELIKTITRLFMLLRIYIPLLGVKAFNLQGKYNRSLNGTSDSFRRNSLVKFKNPRS